MWSNYCTYDYAWNCTALPCQIHGQPWACILTLESISQRHHHLYLRVQGKSDCPEKHVNGQISTACTGIFSVPVNYILIIRIFHGCEMRIEKSVLRSTVWHHEALPNDAKQLTRGTDFSTMIDFFSCIPFDLQRLILMIKVAINESRSYTLTSAILKVGVVCDVAIMSTPNMITTQ